MRRGVKKIARELKFNQNVMKLKIFLMNNYWKAISVFCLVILNFGFGQLLTTTQENYGYLNVNSNPMGLVVYLDGDSVGVTPIKYYQLKPGNYTVSLFASDTIENKYQQFSEGNLTAKYSILLDLAKIGAATQPVTIKPNQTSEVFFSLSKINRTPNKIKLATACCFGGGFSIAFILGYLVATLTK
ncbi:MAG: PEGA domain-containing protein [candidate division WOR-3 bacterium]|nr:PEGA domain-containing protein [candidate division WOR-3 bacterium]